MSPRKIVLATSNAGKLNELQALLAESGIEILPQSAFGIGEVPEPAPTFIENALIKARHASTGSGWAAIADDSGIEVDALKGAPGIHSARFAGTDASDNENTARLLEALQAVEAPLRTARFRCVIALLRHPADPSPIIAEGTWEGHIAQQPRGAGGFGYDPVFVPLGMEETAAELTPEQKNRLSHRAAALRQLAERIQRGF